MRTAPNFFLRNYKIIKIKLVKPKNVPDALITHYDLHKFLI